SWPSRSAWSSGSAPTRSSTRWYARSRAPWCWWATGSSDPRMWGGSCGRATGRGRATSRRPAGSPSSASCTAGAPCFDAPTRPRVPWCVGPRPGPTSLRMKTYSPKPEHIERPWYVIDATDQLLGRTASEAAALLRGKHKPIFAPHMDCGDHVIIVNADKVVLTGGKEMKKVAYPHSGYPGGITGTRYDALWAERPVFAVEKAVKGMLPKNRLGRSMIGKLHVLAGPDH